MGADFLIIRHDLDDDPHVLHMGVILNVDTGLVIDALRKLWRWASIHTQDGYIYGATAMSIDFLVGRPGFAGAACAAGWLEVDVGGALIPNFEEYCSKLAMQKICHKFLQKHPLPAKLQPPDWPGFLEWWKLYPKKKAKLDAQKAWNRIKPTPEIIQEMGRVLALEKRSESWLKDGGKYIPYPATWLNGHRWRDESGPGEAVGQPGRVRTKAGKYGNLGTTARASETEATPPALHQLLPGQDAGHPPDSNGPP